jgi:hypothetical protein
MNRARLGFLWGVVTLFIVASLALGPPRVMAQASKPSDLTTQMQSRMTDAQRYHSTLYPEFRSTWRILENPEVTTHTFDHHNMVETEPADMATLLSKLACSTDVVIRGEVTSAIVNPIDDGTYLFTDYGVTVASLLRTRSSSPQFQERTAVVTRIGGSLVVDKRKVVAIVRDFPLLEIGRSYFLFATYIAKTRAFKATTLGGAFRVTDQTAFQLGPAVTDFELSLQAGIPVDEFVRLLSRVLAKGC